MGNLMGKFFSTAQRALLQLKYGKQIGKVSNSGLICFERSNKNMKMYTTLNASNGQLVRTKRINIHSQNSTTSTVFDAKGNVLLSTDKNKRAICCGIAGNNQFAFEQRIIRTEYNKFGQQINYCDVTMTPRLNKPRVDVLSNKNSSVSKTYLNTQNNSKYTIECKG